MVFVWNILKRIYRWMLMPRARAAVGRLDSADPMPQALARALRAALDRQATLEERDWIHRIEQLREGLNASSCAVQIQDYGASGPHESLSDEQMSQGRTVTRTIGELCRSSSKPKFWAFFLFKLIREFKPTVCLELGTCLGISGCYEAAALKLNHSGRLITLEGAPSLASLAKEHFHTMGLDNVTVVSGRFQDTLPTVLKTHAPIDYAFIDGHHNERATIAYFEQIKPFLSDVAVLVFDDILWSPGMKRAWKFVEADGASGISLDIGGIGICVMSRESKSKKNIHIPMT